MNTPTATTSANVPPRPRFAVFAGSNYYPQGGYRDYRSSFADIESAKACAEQFALDTSHHTGVEWVQVVDTHHGAVHELQEGDWVQTSAGEVAPAV